MGKKKAKEISRGISDSPIYKSCSAPCVTNCILRRATSINHGCLVNYAVVLLLGVGTLMDGSTTGLPMTPGYGGHQQQHTQQPLTTLKVASATPLRINLLPHGSAQVYYTTTYVAPAYTTKAAEYYTTKAAEYYTTKVAEYYTTKAAEYYTTKAPSRYTKAPVYFTTTHAAPEYCTDVPKYYTTKGSEYYITTFVTTTSYTEAPKALLCPELLHH